jgi:hypothetical protein
MTSWVFGVLSINPYLLIHPFDRAQAPPFKAEKQARLRVNLEQVPAF